MSRHKDVQLSFTQFKQNTLIHKLTGKLIRTVKSPGLKLQWTNSENFRGIQKGRTGTFQKRNLTRAQNYVKNDKMNEPF